MYFLIFALRRLLDICSSAFILFVLYYAFYFFKDLFLHIFKKHDFSIKDYVLPLPKAKSEQVIAIILIVGLINTICLFTCSSTRIGAFYEEEEYAETYEATLYINKKPIFCLVDMYREDGAYFIEEIRLPYGHSELLYEEEYKPKEEQNEIPLGNSSRSFKIILLNPATETSYDRLKHTIVSNYGMFCGSKNSDAYHIKNCRYVKSIKEKNLVYFETKQEADILGYLPCSVCQ